MEMMVIFVVALLVLGPTKLPEAGRQVGKALAELRRWSSGVQAELRDAMATGEAAARHDPTPPTVPPAERSTPKPPSSFPDQQSFT